MTLDFQSKTGLLSLPQFLKYAKNSSYRTPRRRCKCTGSSLLTPDHPDSRVCVRSKKHISGFNKRQTLCFYNSLNTQSKPAGRSRQNIRQTKQSAPQQVHVYIDSDHSEDEGCEVPQMATTNTNIR